MSEPIPMDVNPPGLFLDNTTSSSDLLIPEIGKKRKKLSIDERLSRNRERNRIHARKTRERKKFQTAAIHHRIQDLYQEGMRLRQLIDEQYTASSLLGLSQSPRVTSEPTGPHLLPSSSICNNYYEKVLAENSWIKDANGVPYVQIQAAAKRVRRSGKLNPQEREKIRRERNRMHAKKTRDRKKFFLEMSDKIISEMEAETLALRAYLMRIGLMSKEDYEAYVAQSIKMRQQMAEAKIDAIGDSGEEEEEEGEDDEENSEGETASEAEGETMRKRTSPEGSSDENEKVSSWSKSSRTSSNPESGQSSQFPSSKSFSSNTDTAKMSTTSSATYTTNDTKSSHSSNESAQESGKRSEENSGGEERDSPDYNGAAMVINENEWNGKDSRELNSKTVEASNGIESYNLGFPLQLPKPPTNGVTSSDIKESANAITNIHAVSDKQDPIK